MKKCLITGASSGIGLATAKLFLTKNFEVHNFSRRGANSSGITDHKFDLEKLTEKDINIFCETLKNAKQVTVVLNASYLAKDSVLNPQVSELDKSWVINIQSYYRLLSHVISLLPEKSSIIIVGSTLSEIAVKNSWSYVITKHAQAGMMKSLVQDLEGKQIHTALVCPGFTDTPMLRTHIAHDQDILNSLSQMQSLKRLAQPEEIADLIYFASQNPVINGSVLHANLGQIN